MIIWSRVLFLFLAQFFVPARSDFMNSEEAKDDKITNEKTAKDQVPSPSEYGHGDLKPSHGDAKQFMYAHAPDKKQYEFGFKRGNDHHMMERYEKAGPEHNFKAKVRWHDSDGSHGEHYFDYNHGPKYDDHGKDHGGDHSGGDYGHDHGGYHSQPVPQYIDSKSSYSEKLEQNKPAVPEDKIFKRSGLEASESPSEFPIYDPYEIYSSNQGKSSNKFRLKSPYPKKAPSSQIDSDKVKPGPKISVPKLTYDPDTGRIMDENTQKWFTLTPLS